MGKSRPMDENKAGTKAKEKRVPTAEGSLAARAPGASVPTEGSMQSDWAQAGQVNQNMPGDFGGSEQGERGAGSQQSGWSSRQQGQRMQERADEAASGTQQQSGYGGSEQSQHAGSQESPTGPARSHQSGKGGAEQRRGGRPGEQSSDYASGQSRQGGSDRKDQ